MHLVEEINQYMPAFRKKLIKFLHKIKKCYKFGCFIIYWVIVFFCQENKLRHRLNLG